MIPVESESLRRRVSREPDSPIITTRAALLLKGQAKLVESLCPSYKPTEKKEAIRRDVDAGSAQMSTKFYLSKQRQFCKSVTSCVYSHRSSYTLKHVTLQINIPASHAHSETVVGYLFTL